MISRQLKFVKKNVVELGLTLVKLNKNR